MNASRMPGFTADASLLASSGYYSMMTAGLAQAGAIQPQMPPEFTGEWRARADSVTAFYSGGGSHANLADIAERKMCIALARSCRSGNMGACRRMLADCPRH